MRRLLVTGAIAAGIYAVVAILIVAGSHLVGDPLWVPAVIYIGPAAYFIAVAALNRAAFGNVRSAALRWAALLGAPAYPTLVTSVPAVTVRRPQGSNAYRASTALVLSVTSSMLPR